MAEQVTVVVPKGMFPKDNILNQLIEVGLRVIALSCVVKNEDCDDAEMLCAIKNEDYNEDSDWPTKYGSNFENNVFKMHKFCWCEEEDCIYCNGEDDEKNIGKTEPNFIHKKSGLSVWWYKYIGRGMEIEGPAMSSIDILNMISECLKSI